MDALGDHLHLRHARAALASAPQRRATRDASALVWFEPALDAYNASTEQTELQPMAVGELRILWSLSTEELVVESDQFGLRRKALRK